MSEQLNHEPIQEGVTHGPYLPLSDEELQKARLYYRYGPSNEADLIKDHTATDAELQATNQYGHHGEAQQDALDEGHITPSQYVALDEVTESKQVEIYDSIYSRPENIEVIKKLD